MLKRALALLMVLAGCSSPQKPAPTAMANDRFVVYYDNQLPASAFKDYDLVVFDGEHHPDFKILQPHTTVLGYVSIGEIHGHDAALETLREKGAVLSANTQWNSHVMDLRNKAWRNLLLKEKIPALIAAGFDGVMLDTIDSPLALETPEHPSYAGLHYASASLIHDIRKTFPNIKIMLNRGFTLLDAVKNDVDYVLAEGAYAKQASKDNSRPSIWPESAQKPIVDMLHRAMKKNSQLKIYTLDYWDMFDIQGVESIYQAQRARGFIPYVATPDLRSYHAEPTPAKPESSTLRG